MDGLQTIDSILFDADNFFSGFIFYNKATDHLNERAPRDHLDLRVVRIDDVIRENIENTHLVGFRTTKRCSTAKQVMSVQPIYFSVKKDLCENYL